MVRVRIAPQSIHYLIIYFFKKEYNLIIRSSKLIFFPPSDVKSNQSLMECFGLFVVAAEIGSRGVTNPPTHNPMVISPVMSLLKQVTGFNFFLNIDFFLTLCVWVLI